jgi:hypothetical protein
MEAPIKITILSAIFISGLLYVLVISYIHLLITEKSYSLLFDDGAITLEHDGTKFVIFNNNQPGDKMMSISDPVVKDYFIYATTFSKGTQAIDSFEFDPERFSTSDSQPTSIRVSVAGPFELGEYHGWFVFPGANSFSIPVTLSTPPLYAQSIMIISIGALTSIIMIELTKHANKKMDEEKNTLARQELNIAGVQPGDPAFVGLLPSEQTYIINLKRDEIISENKIKAYDARYAGPAAVAKNALLSLVPGIFALLIAILGFVNNDMIGKIIEFNFQNILALFILGLGIESTKLVFDRVKSKTSLEERK